MSDVANRRTNVQKAAFGFGVLFLVLGVAGFIPGLTTNLYDGLPFAGHVNSGHNSQLLGIFEVTVLHNLAHILLGILGIVMSKRVDSSRNFLFGAGFVYALLFLYGMLVDHNSDANFGGFDGADNFLHLLLAVALQACGFLLTKNRRDAVTEGR